MYVSCTHTHAHTHIHTHTYITFRLRITNIKALYFSLSFLYVRDAYQNPFNFTFQFSSVTLSCPTLCDPMNCSTPGLPVHHHLLESTQTHVNWVADAVQQSHPLSSPSPPAPSPSQHQGVFKWVSSSHQVAKVLELQLQHQSFQWTPRTYLLQDGLVGSPCSPRDSQESSPTPQFKSINSSVLKFLYSPTFMSIHDHWKSHSLNFKSKQMLNHTTRVGIAFKSVDRVSWYGLGWE